jgi:hypothetical protein
MFLRLAFACVAIEEPDVLLLDEVFAVGDARFQQKCFRRLRELHDGRTTIVVVTQLAQHLSALCERALVLDQGKLVFDGPLTLGIDRYHQLLFAPGAGPAPASGEPDEIRYGDGGARILDPVALGVDPLQPGDLGHLAFDVEFARSVDGAHVGLACSTAAGVYVYVTSTLLLGTGGIIASAGERSRVEITFAVPLAVDDLFVDLSLFELVDGAASFLDARVAVSHLRIARPAHYLGVTDLGAEIRSEVLRPRPRP